MLEEGFSKVVKETFLQRNRIRSAHACPRRAEPLLLRQQGPRPGRGLRLCPEAASSSCAEPEAPQRPDWRKPWSQPQTFRLEMERLRPGGVGQWRSWDQAPGS